jgi:hypothetical protein
MRIVYSVELDDVVTFQTFNADRSPTIRKFRRKVFVSAVIVGTLCFAGIVRLLGDTSIVPWVCGAVGAIAIVTWYALSPRSVRSKFWNRSQERIVRKMYAVAQNPATFGAREIELDDDGLAARSTVTESTILWRAIERIKSTDQHTFIYVGPGNAIVIPRRTVKAGDYDEFVDELNRKHAASRGSYRSATHSPAALGSKLGFGSKRTFLNRTSVASPECSCRAKMPRGMPEESSRSTHRWSLIHVRMRLPAATIS